MKRITFQYVRDYLMGDGYTIERVGNEYHIWHIGDHTDVAIVERLQDICLDDPMNSQ